MELPKKNFQFGMGQVGTTNNKHIKIKNTVRSTQVLCEPVHQHKMAP
jgi:hypothetical protein